VKELKVTSQKEYDQIDPQKEQTQITIDSPANTWLRITKVPDNSHVVAWGSSHVVARGSSHVVARGSSHVEAWDSSHVEAWDSSHVEAWDSSHVEAWDSSHVEARGSSHVVARGSSHVEAWDSSHVEAWDSSHVVARGSSHVVARGSSHVEAWEYVTVTRKSKNSRADLHGKALLQDASQDLTFISLKEWFDWWDVKPAKGKVRFFKAVRPDGTDFYSGKIHYDTGKTLQCPDWLEDYNEECGHGFHVSPHVFLTDAYAGAKDHIHIAVEVRTADIRLPKTFTMPDKIRCRKLKVLEIVEEES
jgi:hypothetical protein